MNHFVSAVPSYCMEIRCGRWYHTHIVCSHGCLQFSSWRLGYGIGGFPYRFLLSEMNGAKCGRLDCKMMKTKAHGHSMVVRLL